MNKQNDQKKNPFAEMEEEVQAFWEKSKIFEKSVKTPAGAEPTGDYVFYDGPPFATGTPHYGHIVASIIKDVVPRYWTMNGKRVERKWGWDCHGLPIENIVEKEMGSRSKKDIEEKGVKEFNELCRSKVLSYVDDWEKVIGKLGRWADMKNAYRTMDIEFMESVWWVFKELWDKGLIYKDHRSMHVCPRCETTLSQSEVTEGYKDIKDLSCIAKFEVLDPSVIPACPPEWRGERSEGRESHELTSEQDQRDPLPVASSNLADRQDDSGVEGKTYILAWTTTPWTLVGNVALAVSSDPLIDYIKLEVEAVDSDKFNLRKGDSIIFVRNSDTECRLFGEKLSIHDDLTTANVNYKNSGNVLFKNIKLFKGAELVGLEYKPLFDYYSSDEKLENRENGWKVYAGDFVTTDEGTGVVHIAPAFGEDDMRLGRDNKLPFVQHVKMDGYFANEVEDFAGLNVKPKSDKKDAHMTTDVEIIKYLAHNNVLFYKEKYEHSYPHCWRCDTPLINYATSSWFVSVTDVKPRALETAKSINWSPNHIKEGRFGKWMEGARDWSISRQRFWASVMPIWECSCGEREVFGSVKDLEERSGEKVNDLHKHIVDEITMECKKCQGVMKRIPDVLDTWFDSGSMPFAQMHYPFENKEKFENNFPAEFIAEGTDQTRCWFYYMHVLANGLKKTNAFKNVIVNGIVLAEDGKKMSKKLQNYPDPTGVMDQYGADALRYYLSSSPVMLADNLCFSEEGVKESLRKVVMITWNVVKFYDLFAQKYTISVSLQKGDQGMGGESCESSEQLNQQDSVASLQNVSNILDQWIILRLNQLIEEVRGGMEKYDLPHASRPIVKFTDDLSTWYLRRSRDRFKGDDEQDKQAALSTTKFVLTELSKVMAPFTPFIAEQIWQKITGNEFKNEDKSVHLEKFPGLEGEKQKVSDSVFDEMAEVRKIVEMGLAKRDEVNVKIRQPLNELKIKNYKLRAEYEPLLLDELNVKSVVCEDGEGDLSVELDTNITEELKLEGHKREMVRFINAMRKNMGLTIEDTVEVGIDSDSDEIKKVIEKYAEEIKGDVLASAVNIGVDNCDETKEVKVNSLQAIIGIKK